MNTSQLSLGQSGIHARAVYHDGSTLALLCQRVDKTLYQLSFYPKKAGVCWFLVTLCEIITKKFFFIKYKIDFACIDHFCGLKKQGAKMNKILYTDYSIFK